MKIGGKNSSIYNKLIFSFILIIIISISFCGVITNYFFYNNYKFRSLQMNEAAVSYTTNLLDESIFQKVIGINDSLFIVPSINNTLLDIEKNGASYDAMKIFSIYSQLTNLVSQNNDLISGIHIYIKSKSMIVSSFYGYRILDESSLKTMEALYWIYELEDIEDNQR